MPDFGPVDLLAFLRFASIWALRGHARVSGVCARLAARGADVAPRNLGDIIVSSGRIVLRARAARISRPRRIRWAGVGPLAVSPAGERCCPGRPALSGPGGPRPRRRLPFGLLRRAAKKLLPAAIAGGKKTIVGEKVFRNDLRQSVPEPLPACPAEQAIVDTYARDAVLANARDAATVTIRLLENKAVLDDPRIGNKVRDCGLIR